MKDIKIDSVDVLQTLLELGVDFFCLCDLQGSIKKVSPSWRSELGWSEEELLHESITRFIPAEERNLLANAITLKSKTNTSASHFESWVLQKNKIQRRLSWSIQINTDASLIFLTAKDITKKYRIEKALHEERSSTMALVQSLDDVVLEMNDKYEYMQVWASDATKVWQPPSEIIGKTLRDIIGVEKAIVFEKSIDTVFSTGLPQVIDYPDPFVSDRWFSCKMSLVHNELTDEKKVCFLIRDISEKVKSDKQRQKAEQALLQGSKLAALGEMAAGIAHEVNNPLTIILLKAEAMRAKLLRTQSDSTLNLMTEINMIEATCQRIVKIVHGLKTFSRDADFDPMERSSAVKIIDESLSLCREKLVYHNVEIKRALDPAVYLDCRPTQIGQVILNLISNSVAAIKGKKNPWIDIRVETRDEKAIFAITDSGSGIPKEIASRIFEPFFTTKEVGSGTGLGLSISKGIIESHSGKFWLDTDCAHTRFIIELPLSEKQI